MLRQDALDMTIANYRFQMLKAALDLYRSAGGTEQSVRDLCSKAFHAESREVADATADLMLALAAVSHLSDIDMMQAAYNELDRGLQDAPTLLEAI